LNHSCVPNCALVVCEGEGGPVVVIRTLKALRKGATLLACYNWTREEWSGVGGCRCGNSVCVSR